MKIRKLKISKLTKRIRLRTWVSLGLIIVLTPLIFAMVYGVWGALGGSNATPFAHWAFDEGVDNTCSGGSNDACDSSGNGYDITRNGNVSWHAEDKCISGNCLYFDGDADYMDLGDNANFEFGQDQDFSLSTWFKVSNFNAQGSYLITKGAIEAADGQAAGIGYALNLTINDTLVFSIRDESTLTRTSVLGTTALSENTWYHVAVSADRDGSAIIYLNGRQYATGNISARNAGTASASAFRMGVYTSVTTYAEFNGFMDEVKVFDTALSAAQVKAEMAGGAAVLGAQNTDFLNEGLVGYWKMEEAGDATRVDSSGNGNDLVETASDTIAQVGGKFGNAGDFELGDAENLSDSSFTGFTNGSSVTLSAWVNIESAPSCSSCTSAPIFFDSVGLGLNEADSDDNISGVTVIYWNGSGYSPIGTSSNSLVTATWYHIAITYDADADIYKTFVNGQLQTSGSLTFNTTGASVSLGGSLNDNYDGIIDEARIYNRALSPAEVSALYNWAPGPVGYWKLDENTGTNAFDSSGNGLNGTLTNSPTWSTGKFGGALNFNATANDTYVTIADNSALEGFSTMTACAWIYHNNDVDVDADVIITKPVTAVGVDSTDPHALWFLGMLPGNNAYFYVSTGSASSRVTVTSSGTVSLDTWHHVCGIYNGANIRISIDGVLDSASTNTTLTVGTNTIDTRIGAWMSSNGGAGNDVFDGKLDEIKVYNYARTQQQIIEDMNAGHPTGGSPIGSQLHYWNFDEMQGDTANDTIGTANGNLAAGTSCPQSGDSACPTWTASGKVNGALDFDTAATTDDYVSVASPNLPTGDFTYTLWVNPDTAANTLLMASDGTGNNEIALTIDSSDSNKLKIFLDGGAADAASSQAIATGTWTHLGVTRSGGAITLYINGKADGTGTDATVLGFSTCDLLIGVDADTTCTADLGEYFDGKIDEVKIYTSALTAEQIKIDMNAGANTNFGTGTNEKATTYGGPGGNPPVGYWDLNENTGTSAADKSGNGYTGTLTNGPTWVPGKHGSGVQFDGNSSNHFITVADTAALSPITTGAFTVQAWFNQNTDTVDRDWIVSKGNTSNFEYGVAVYNGVIYCELWDSAGNSIAQVNTGAVSTGVWHFVSCTMNNTTGMVLYLDGVVVGTSGGVTGGSSNTTSAFQIGNREDGGENNFDGVIDEVKVFDYALSQAQVAYEYNRGGPMGWWKFDECTGATAYDYALTANEQDTGKNGTITPGALDNTATGTCSSGTGTEMWNDGTTGKFNGSLGFDGDDDYVVVASPTLPTEDFTIALWWRGTTVGNETLFHVPNAANGNELQLKSASQVQLFTNNSQTVTGASTLSTATWYHLAATRSGSALTVYVNGKSDGTGTDGTAFDFSTCSIYIGTDFGCGATQANPADGQIDDVRVYNYAMSADQIQKVMNGDSGTGSAARFGPVTGSP